MLNKRNYELEYMRELQEKYKKDPALLERVLYAFGLLEALKVSGMPFVFKGGTCLMLLLEHPMRLSTDIDIIVTPGTDVDQYIRKAGTIFPFVTCEEQIRVGRNSIEKRHFKFIYQSPLQEKEFYILLDILFSEIPYVETIEKEVKNELLIVDGLKTMVTCFLKEKEFVKIEHPEIYIEQKIDQKKYKGLSSIKKQKLEAYGYLVEVALNGINMYEFEE